MAPHFEHGSWSLAVCAALCVVGCGEDEEATAARRTLLDEPLSSLPSKLSDTGIHTPGSELELSPNALAYEPGYPLWSDGGSKERAVVLPPGSKIDASDPTSYVFPVGTLIFKTFWYRTPESPRRELPVETRLLRLGEAGWELGAYAWDEAGRDAELLDLRRAQTRPILGDDEQLVLHSIPSRLECQQCHDSGTSAVLGINELELHASGGLVDFAPWLTPAPSEPYAQLPERGPLTRQVLGYLVGNCVHCHNGTNGAASSFDLRPAVALENLIGVPTSSSATADGVRVEPGQPEASILYLALRGVAEKDVKDMPPVGVAARDEAALELFARWITALGENRDP